MTGGRVISSIPAGIMTGERIRTKRPTADDHATQQIIRSRAIDQRFRPLSPGKQIESSSRGWRQSADHALRSAAVRVSDA